MRNQNKVNQIEFIMEDESKGIAEQKQQICHEKPNKALRTKTWQGKIPNEK